MIPRFIKRLIGRHTHLFAHEAQKIPEIGQNLKQISANAFFWRTYHQKVVGLIEEREGELFGYECKWSSSAKNKPPKAFAKAYPDADYTVIHPENYLDYLADG